MKASVAIGGEVSDADCMSCNAADFIERVQEQRGPLRFCFSRNLGREPALDLIGGWCASARRVRGVDLQSLLQPK